MSKLGEAMQEGMEATVGAMAPIFAAQMIQASAESIRAFLQAAESARNLGYMELCVELIERASKLLARPVTP